MGDKEAAHDLKVEIGALSQTNTKRNPIPYGLRPGQ
jgi:hypothetical protein